MLELWLTKGIWKSISCLLLIEEIIIMKLKVIQTKSIIDRPKDQKMTIKALGLGRPNYSKVHNDTPQIRGMLNKVSHLVRVEEIK